MKIERGNYIEAVSFPPIGGLFFFSFLRKLKKYKYPNDPVNPVYKNLK